MSGYYKEHVSIEIASKRRTLGTIEDFTTRLSHQIKFSQKPSKSYWMRLENTLIPKTYYDINSTNNVFKVVETAGTSTVTISAGNYTITELLTELESGLDTASDGNDDNAYIFTYDDVTNKVGITFTAGGTATVSTIALGSTLNALLGFGKADTDTITGGDSTLVLTSTVESTAPNCVDLLSVDLIIIETSITSENYYNEVGQVHIGVRVPMLVDRNEVQYYANDSGHLSKMNSKAPLSQIEFALKDQDGNTIDLCEVDWSTEVVIYELTEKHKATNEHSRPIPSLLGGLGRGRSPFPSPFPSRSGRRN